MSGDFSIIGPLLGGAILEFASWHWLFYINIPIAILAIILVFMTFHFPDETQVQQSRFDIKGLIIFYIFIAINVWFTQPTSYYFNIFSIILAFSCFMDAI